MPRSDRVPKGKAIKTKTTSGASCKNLEIVQPDDLPDDIPVIDLTDPVNANWREILRNDPNDPRFDPGYFMDIKLSPGTPDMRKLIRAKKKRNQKASARKSMISVGS